MVFREKTMNKQDRTPTLCENCMTSCEWWFSVCGR